jgi:hypothetical protein
MEKNMNSTVRQLIYWTPRIIGLLVVALFTLLSFEVLTEGLPFGEAMLAWLTHLIPAALLGAAMAITWHREWVGGILFILYSLLYLVAFQGAHVAIYLWMALPLLVAGILFFVDWRLRIESQDDS